MTLFAPRGDPVPDALREETARHHDEKTLAAMVTWIALRYAVSPSTS